MKKTISEIDSGRDGKRIEIVEDEANNMELYALALYYAQKTYQLLLAMDERNIPEQE